MIALTSLLGFLVVFGQVMLPYNYSRSTFRLAFLIANRSWVALPHTLGQLQLLFCFWCWGVEYGLLSCSALPLADRSRRSFRAGVAPEYQWLRDASVQCMRILKSTDVRSTARAMQL